VQDLKEGEVGFPMDGQSLGRLMHKRGINIRYLGKLATLAEEQGSRLRALKALATQEMIARAFKHLANHYLKDLPTAFATACHAHLLNCLLGTGVNGSPTVELDEDLRFFYKDANYTFTEVNPKSLQAEIESQVQLRYRYVLEADWVSSIKHVQMLREIALKLGLQLTAKDYHFAPEPAPENDQSASAANGDAVHSALNGHVANGGSHKKKRKNGGRSSPSSSNGSVVLDSQVTFTADDIVNLVPIIKDASPKSTLAEEALEAGRISMMQNQKELGQELLLESLSLHEQIYGILHPEVARVYHQLAMLYYQLDEKSAAVELAHKAVIISERTLGIDSNETILSYLNLGLFEHGNGNTTVALSCMRHALELWKIIYGLKHPDSITTINNAAVMLQHLKYYHESRLWFETSLAISEEVSGKQSVNTATLSFQLAQALALDQDPKGAVNRMRDAYSVFLAKLGPDDRNTKESEGWLEQLTQNAVSIARHAKDIQARRIRKVLLTPKVTLGTRPQPQVGQSPADVVNGRDARSSRGLDSRSIDELMSFIEGGGDTSKKTPTKKRMGRNGPRTRRT
jgi:protein TIF31